MTLLFYYTLLIMFFYTIVAATSLSAFYVSHRRTFLYATFGFTFYFFDVSLVFKDKNPPLQNVGSASAAARVAL